MGRVDIRGRIYADRNDLLKQDRDDKLRDAEFFGLGFHSRAIEAKLQSPQGCHALKEDTTDETN